jgi:hypothetical protein
VNHHNPLLLIFQSCLPSRSCKAQLQSQFQAFNYQISHGGELLRWGFASNSNSLKMLFLWLMTVVMGNLSPNNADRFQQEILVLENDNPHLAEECRKEQKR